MRPDSVVVGYLHPGDTAHSFMHSYDQMRSYELMHENHLYMRIAEECGAGRITQGRNSVVRQFLTTPAEWLLFIDSDMGFEPTLMTDLLAVADKDERPIVGALAFAQRKGPDAGYGARNFDHVPTLYRWVDQDNIAGFVPITDYPKNTLCQVDATGAACMLIHRSVLEKMCEVFPEPLPWFADTVYKGQVFGEDMTFCRRAAELDYKIHVHTGIQTSHYKQAYLTEQTVRLNIHAPNFVVIPVKDRLDLTQSLLEELDSQGGHDAIFVMDNGSGPETKEWLESQAIAEVFDCEGLNYHQMVNIGMDEALRRSWPCNIAVLNNDLKIGPDLIKGMARALRSDAQIGVVCPNYDGRPGSGLQMVGEICANRYDGTGGLAGFAFMLRGEAGYRFPEELQWWYGDNHLLANVLLGGSRAAIALDVSCEHIDGGSQTGAWESDEMQPILEADRQWFEGWVRQVMGQPAA